MQPDILLVGSGNVATQLAEVFVQCNIPFVITGRNAETLQVLAGKVGVTSYPFSALSNGYSMAILAVQDEQIVPAAAALEGKCTAMVHTSGAIPSQVLSAYVSAYGVLYPLQTFRKDITANWHEIPICIDASTGQLYTTLHQLAASISPRVYRVNDEQRPHLHLAAVIVNNFANHLAVKAKQYCLEHKIDFSMLYPLILQTAERIVSSKDLESLQTGPARRGDLSIVEKHIQMIRDTHDDTLAEIYSMLSRSIVQNIIER